MTLKLVADNDLQSGIAHDLRQLASAIDAGDYGKVTTLLVLIDTPDSLHLEAIGHNPSRYETIGLLEWAKDMAFGD